MIQKEHNYLFNTKYTHTHLMDHGWVEYKQAPYNYCHNSALDILEGHFWTCE